MVSQGKGFTHHVLKQGLCSVILNTNHAEAKRTGIEDFWGRHEERYSDNLFAINECIMPCKIITLTSTLVFLPHPHFLNSLSGKAESKRALKNWHQLPEPKCVHPLNPPQSQGNNLGRPSFDLARGCEECVAVNRFLALEHTSGQKILMSQRLVPCGPSFTPFPRSPSVTGSGTRYCGLGDGIKGLG